MKTKLILTGLLLACSLLNIYAQERLGMFVETKRYLDENNNTKFVIDYQVPYKNLIFMTRDNTFFAELKVTLSISIEDSVLVTKEFTNNIGVTRKHDVTTSNKSYLDRIALTLAKAGYVLDIRFEDINSDKSFAWSYTTELINPDEKLSDLELLSAVTPDTLFYSQKFQRGNRIHLPEPSGFISREVYDSLYIYSEAYNVTGFDSKAVLTIIRDDSSVLINTYRIQKPSAYQQLLFPVSISSMNPGQYIAVVEFTDDNTTYSRSYDFVITEQQDQQFFIFTDPDDEFQLIRYIASPKAAGSWKSMSKEAKRRYISNFWIGVAGMRNQSVEEVLKIYRDRVEYSNARFSHFSKGWKSDLGRIYIRNGAPWDVVGSDDVGSYSETDEFKTKFVRKDFQVWKYHGLNKAVYLFVDIQMNGNYKLVYAKNDEQESTLPDWSKYVDSDFNTALLDN
jgi:GWxTD domain-containing protein